MNHRVYMGILPNGYLDKQAIFKVVRDGFIFCGAATAVEKLQARISRPEVLLKPTLLFAGDESLSKHSSTHTDIVEGAVNVIDSFLPHCTIKLMAENNPLKLSPHQNMRLAGYDEWLKRGSDRIEVVYPEADAPIKYLFSKEKNYFKRDIEASSLYKSSHYRVYCPKVRTDVFSGGFFGAIRAGLSNPSDFENEIQCADFLEVCSPDLIISDAVIVPAGGGSFTQRGQDLGLILISNNALAHDWVLAQTLNLDITKIPHLKLALDRHAGPRTFEEIQVGGIPEAFIKNLSAKTKHWRLGTPSLNQFRARYEYENPGLRFPFEIISDGASSMTHLLLDCLNIACDVSKRKNQISRWNKASVLVGAFKDFPKHKLVFAFGRLATESLRLKTSRRITFFRAFNMQISYITLKNSETCWAYLLTKDELSYWKVALLFFIGSTSRIRLPYFKIPLIFRRLLSFSKNPVKQADLVLTSHLNQNENWAFIHRKG